MNYNMPKFGSQIVFLANLEWQIVSSNELFILIDPKSIYIYICILSVYIHMYCTYDHCVALSIKMIQT